MGDAKRPGPGPGPAIGLCAQCRHRRELTSARGSVFHRCALAEEDERYPRYPPLPVRRCSGFEAVPDEDAP